MSFGKAATLFFILCMLTQPLFAENTEFTELKNLNEKEHRYHESINVLFTYRAPKNFSKGDKLFLYFIIVNLVDGETIKARVKKISKSNQRVQARVRLKSTELVYAFIFSKHHPFASFQRSDVGILKAHIDHRSQEQLNFAEYDPSTGATLFDPFHLERLNPPLKLMRN